MELTEKAKEVFFSIQEAIDCFYEKNPDEFFKIVDVYNRLLNILKKEEAIDDPEMETLRIMVDVYKQEFNVSNYELSSMIVVLKDKISEFKNRTLN